MPEAGESPLAEQLGADPRGPGALLSDLTSSLRREGELLISAAGRAGLDSEVPTCPGWRVRDLVHHTGAIHLWAATHVREQRREQLGPEETAALTSSRPADDLLLGWYRAAHQRVVAALEQASPQLSCWTFLPAPSPLVFWARRQAHETEIHRADVEAASASITPVPVVAALDGIEEMLFGFAARPRRIAVDRPRRLALAPRDAQAGWMVEIGPAGVAASRASGTDCDCRVVDTASNLFLLLWNRLPEDGPEVTGDRGLIDLWRRSIRVRWS
ncbi:MAG: maleylpyruvate isomerase family mycothiol-dependent enzyme [Candidatus Dormiibacterota bacterium]